MTTDAIKHIIERTRKCREYGSNMIEIQTANRYFAIDERDGTLYELLESCQLLVIYNASECIYIDTTAILNISVDDADNG